MFKTCTGRITLLKNSQTKKLGHTFETMYKYTSAKWLTPNGVCIDEVGLKPDIEIDASADYTKDLVYNAAMDAISK